MEDFSNKTNKVKAGTIMPNKTIYLGISPETYTKAFAMPIPASYGDITGNDVVSIQSASNYNMPFGHNYSKHRQLEEFREAIKNKTVDDGWRLGTSEEVASFSKELLAIAGKQFEDSANGFLLAMQFSENRGGLVGSVDPSSQKYWVDASSHCAMGIFIRTEKIKTAENNQNSNNKTTSCPS